MLYTDEVLIGDSTMGIKPFIPWFALPVVLALPVIISAQSAPHPQPLVVNGPAGKTTGVPVNGRPYVDVEALAQIANGTVAFKDNQITLTVPSSASDSGTAGQPSPPGFSKEFLCAAIESIAAVREWRIGIATAIQNSISVTDSSVSAFQRQANDSLRQASVAAVTATDRAALQLLTNENNMQKWSDQLIAARKTLQYMSPEDI